MKLKKGDQVQVLRGKDRGKKGKIEKVYPREGMVLVSKVNLVKKHVKPQGEKNPGGIVEIAKPLPIAKVGLVCSKCNQPVKVGYRVPEKGQKNRICRKCQSLIN